MPRHKQALDGGWVTLGLNPRAVLRAADDEEEKEEKPKTKTVKETVWDWELLNDNKALWLRSPSDVSAEEYEKFYQALAKAR